MSPPTGFAQEAEAKVVTGAEGSLVENHYGSAVLDQSRGGPVTPGNHRLSGADIEGTEVDADNAQGSQQGYP